MAGFGFGEGMPTTPHEEKKDNLPQGVRGLEDVAAEQLARATEKLAVQPVETVKERVEPVLEEPQVEAPKTYTFRFDEGGKAHLENEARLEKEAQELKPELEKTPEKEREKISVGFRNVGFFVEETKNNFFAGIFNKMAATQMKEKGMAPKFISKLGKGFDHDAAKARERIEMIEKTKNRETLANAGYLLGNTIKYGRTVLDIAGVTVAAPLRFATMGAMAFSRGAEAVKEVRLDNEKVIEKTRIEDMEKAAEEAYEVYRTAMARSGGQPAGRDYEKAYHEILPGDLLRRLQEKTPEQPSLVNRFVQGVVKFQIERSVKKLVEKKDRIEGDPRFSGKQRDEKKKRLFNRFERRLKDYDRVVGQFGTVDALAMGARYAEVAGKVAAYVPTAYIALEKAFEAVGDVFSDAETSEALDGLREVPPPRSLPPGYESAAAPALQSEITATLRAHAETPETVPASSTAIARPSIEQIKVSEQPVPEILEKGTATEISAEQMGQATVGKGEGVTHALVRQLRQNAEQFGYDPKSGVNVEKWAVLKSNEIAIENGYIKPDGTEIRVLDQGPKGNPAYLLEKDASGKLKVAEYLEGKPTGGGSAKSAYEYEWKKAEPLPEKLAVKSALEAVRELPARQAVEDALTGTPDELSVKEAADVIPATKASAPVFERIPVKEMPAMKLPEWLTERVEYAKFAENLPERTADLEIVKDHFDTYSLASQEFVVKSYDAFEKKLEYLEKHADTLGLTPSQEEFIAMSKESIVEMREMLTESHEAFKEQLADVGISHASYEKAIMEKGITVKDLLGLRGDKSLDEKKWGKFLDWVSALRPTPGEREMKVNDFLRALTPENFILGKL